MAESLAGAALQALGDANRRAIVEELRGGERSVVELTRRLQISQPAVSRHLRLLRQAGLVEDEAAGARRLYRLRAEGAQAVRAYIEGVWGEAAARVRLAAANAPGPGAERGSSPCGSSSTSTASQVRRSGHGRSERRCGGRPRTRQQTARAPA